MANIFDDEVKFKTNKELKEIIINSHTYAGPLIAASRREMERRGIVFSEMETALIEEKKKKEKWERLKETDHGKQWGAFEANWDRNIVTDLEAPALYSRKAIMWFSFFFSLIFGGVLLALNLKSLNRKGQIPMVLIYSIGFTLIEVLLFRQVITRPGVLPMLANMLGSILLFNYFWKKDIGVNFQYRIKDISKPAIISLIIIVLYILYINFSKNF